MITIYVHYLDAEIRTEILTPWVQGCQIKYLHIHYTEFIFWMFLGLSLDK